MAKVSDNFIMIFNRSFKGEDKLSPFELFLYSFLYRSRLEYAVGWVTSTNIKLIESMIKCNVEGKGNKKLDTIKNTLLSLQNKKYIFSTVDEGKRNDELLNITFPIVDEKEDGFTGFLKMPYVTFDSFDDRENYYIFAFLESNYNTEQKRHYNNKLSFSDWSKLLEVSKSTAQNRVDSMNTSNANPRIYKFSGDYNGTEKQDENLYFTRPDEALILKWNNFYDENGKAKYKPSTVKFSKDDIIFNPFNGDVTYSEFENYIESSSWGEENDDPFTPGRYKKLEIEDYYYYRICKEHNIYLDFIKKCEYIISAKKKAFNYDGCFEEWEKEFRKDKEDGNIGIEIKSEETLSAKPMDAAIEDGTDISEDEFQENIFEYGPFDSVDKIEEEVHIPEGTSTFGISNKLVYEIDSSERQYDVTLFLRFMMEKYPDEAKGHLNHRQQSTNVWQEYCGICDKLNYAG